MECSFKVFVFIKKKKRCLFVIYEYESYTMVHSLVPLRFMQNVLLSSIFTHLKFLIHNVKNIFDEILLYNWNS